MLATTLKGLMIRRFFNESGRYVLDQHDGFGTGGRD